MWGVKRAKEAQALQMRHVKISPEQLSIPEIQNSVYVCTKKKKSGTEHQNSVWKWQG